MRYRGRHSRRTIITSIAEPRVSPDTIVLASQEPLEVALYCEPRSEGRHYSRRQRAHILGPTYARPDPEPTKQRSDEA